MGVLNVTPDSFSDGGRYADRDAAVAARASHIGQGADVIDVGGESTRPGAGRVDADTEIGRVVPVVRESGRRRHRRQHRHHPGRGRRRRTGSGCRDRQRRVRRAGRPAHGQDRRGSRLPLDADALAWAFAGDGTARDLSRRGRRGACGAARSGRRRDRGRGRRDQHRARPGHRVRQDGRAQLAAQRPPRPELSLGFPVLFAASRKSYLGALLAAPDGTPRPVDQREAATLATTVLAVEAGVWGVRVHEVRRRRSDAIRRRGAATRARR